MRQSSLGFGFARRPPQRKRYQQCPARGPAQFPPLAAYGEGTRAARERLRRVLLTNHVLSGALIGALARRPLPAFALGVASHFALDAVPHWGGWPSRRRFLRVAVPDGLVGLAAMGALAALSPPGRRAAVLAGMSGAALPDADKPITLWFGASPFPPAVNRFHDRVQREALDRSRVELLAAGVLAAAALAAVRGSRPRPPRGLSR
jgi:hypothetical protein